jgi:hypothetical protein
MQFRLAGGLFLATLSLAAPMLQPKLNLELLSGRLAICRLAAKAQVPSWAEKGNFTTVTRTAGELSVVCPEANVPQGVKCETGRRAGQPARAGRHQHLRRFDLRYGLPDGGRT